MRRALRQWFLLITVLLGQWQAIAHAAEHALAPTDPGCAYCVAGVGPAPPPAEPVALLAPVEASFAPVAAVEAFHARTPTGPRSSRGPPAAS